MTMNHTLIIARVSLNRVRRAVFRCSALAALLLAAAPVAADSQTLLPGFQKIAQFNEQVRWTRLDSGIRSVNGQIEFFIHRNPDNKILHTALVGEMNGPLQSLTLGTDLAGKWGDFGGPRAYANWIQPKCSHS
jgi:hypothetical protein